MAAWSLAGFTVLERVAALVLLGLNASGVGANRMGGDVILAVTAGMYAGAGLVITSRLPGNAIGWLLGLIGLSLATTLLMEQSALDGLAPAPRSVPAGRPAGRGAGWGA